MSNNKQTMKLYTEKEVIKSIELARLTLNNGSEYSIPIILKVITPIELPSDQEIEDYADNVIPYAEKIGGETYTAYKAIKLGAKWMLNKIQGGNK